MVPASDTKNLIRYIKAPVWVHNGTSLITHVHWDAEKRVRHAHVNFLPRPGQGTKGLSISTQHPLLSMVYFTGSLDLVSVRC